MWEEGGLMKAFDYKYQVLIVISLGTFMVVLDTTIVNIALPKITAVFSATTDQSEIVLDRLPAGPGHDHAGHELLIAAIRHEEVLHRHADRLHGRLGAVRARWKPWHAQRRADHPGLRRRADPAARAGLGVRR